MSKKFKTRKVMRNARLKRNLTQSDLAFKVNVAPNYIAMVERGERQPSVTLAKELSKVLGVPWNDIIGND